MRSRQSVPRQVIGEILSLGHRRGGAFLDNARRVASLLEQATEVLDTTSHATHGASDLARQYHLQYFDALICTVARSAGAELLISEHMQDGLKLGELTILNPFATANRARLEGLFGT